MRHRGPLFVERVVKFLLFTLVVILLLLALDPLFFCATERHLLLSHNLDHYCVQTQCRRLDNSRPCRLPARAAAPPLGVVGRWLYLQAIAWLRQGPCLFWPRLVLLLAYLLPIYPLCRVETRWRALALLAASPALIISLAGGFAVLISAWPLWLLSSLTALAWLQKTRPGSLWLGLCLALVLLISGPTATAAVVFLLALQPVLPQTRACRLLLLLAAVFLFAWHSSIPFHGPGQMAYMVFLQLPLAWPAYLFPAFLVSRRPTCSAAQILKGAILLVLLAWTIPLHAWSYDYLADMALTLLPLYPLFLFSGLTVLQAQANKQRAFLCLWAVQLVTAVALLLHFYGQLGILPRFLQQGLSEYQVMVFQQILPLF